MWHAAKVSSLILIPLCRLFSSTNAVAAEDVVNNLRGGSDAESDLNGERARSEQNVDGTAWWRDERILKAGTYCPYPDSTSLSSVRSGQYGSETGDCYYMYWDSNQCHTDKKCPLYIYVDGTEHGSDIDDRDTTFMREMAARGYVAVTVDYDDTALNYANGCPGFSQKSKKIFDDSIEGSVLYQLCQDPDNDFGHRDVVPVDCNEGVAVNGWSQGGHITALANNFSPLITAGLFWGNGNYCTPCVGEFPVCSICWGIDVSCMNSNQIVLPKEKRRNISGEQDTFFGACKEDSGNNYRQNVIDQLRAVSGVSCDVSKNDCFSPNSNQAGYYVAAGVGHELLDVTPNSYFMDPDNPWGLTKNFDWLAKEGRLMNSDDAQSSTASTTSNFINSPTSSPIASKVSTTPVSSPTKSGSASIWKLFGNWFWGN